MESIPEIDPVRRFFAGVQFHRNFLGDFAECNQEAFRAGRGVKFYNQEILNMADSTNDFLYPRSRYHGQVKPENLVFNANLQEFAQRVSYICNLETAGKIQSEEAYRQIKALWKEIKHAKEQLGVGQDPFRPEDGET